MKACATCLFYTRSDWGRNLCSRSVNKKDVLIPDPIRGGTQWDTDVTGELRRCEVERSRRLFGCGPKARFHLPV